jgi:hypothetical protein
MMLPKKAFHGYPFGFMLCASSKTTLYLEMRDKQSAVSYWKHKNPIQKLSCITARTFAHSWFIKRDANFQVEGTFHLVELESNDQKSANELSITISRNPQQMDATSYFEAVRDTVKNHLKSKDILWFCKWFIRDKSSSAEDENVNWSFALLEHKSQTWEFFFYREKDRLIETFHALKKSFRNMESRGANPKSQHDLLQSLWNREKVAPREE